MGVRKAILAVVMTLFATGAAGRSAEMKRYADYYLGFELSYPTSYKIRELPCSLARWLAEMGYQKLLYLSTGTGQNQGSILVLLDRRHFSLGTLETLHAHTGLVEPDKIQFGAHTFYLYSGGGGGVTYPDDYLYNLKGSILEISFGGPCPPGSKSPSKKTQEIEKKVLESFRVLVANGTGWK